MATVTPLSGVRPEHRGLSFWMGRVAAELKNVRSSRTRCRHDLRVAIRRCRSLAAVMEEVDPDPAWPEMRKVARKLFRSLGALRDAQVMDEWVKKAGPGDRPRSRPLASNLRIQNGGLRETALRAAEKFDEKSWKRLEHALRQRSRFVPGGSLAAECLALERFESAPGTSRQSITHGESQAVACAAHRIEALPLYVEGFLPEHYAAWSESLKRVQDLLGEVHDLDVLSDHGAEIRFGGYRRSRRAWKKPPGTNATHALKTYRQLTLGRTSLWNEWRAGLPANGRIEAAAMARLRATARATDLRPRRTSQISRVAVALFERFKARGFCSCVSRC